MMQHETVFIIAIEDLSHLTIVLVTFANCSSISRVKRDYDKASFIRGTDTKIQLSTNLSSLPIDLLVALLPVGWETPKLPMCMHSSFALPRLPSQIQSCMQVVVMQAYCSFIHYSEHNNCRNISVIQQ